jgi:hypothetical protein
MLTIERLNYLTVALLDSDIPETCYEDYFDLLYLVKMEIERQGDAISLTVELAALKSALDGIREWAHDYGIDHDDKAMQELEAILDGTADKEAH